MKMIHVVLILLTAVALAALVLAVLKVLAIITNISNHSGGAYETMFLLRQALYAISLMVVSWLAYKKILVLTGLDQGSEDA
jgi:hypothetical protein